MCAYIWGGAGGLWRSKQSGIKLWRALNTSPQIWSFISWVMGNDCKSRRGTGKTVMEFHPDIVLRMEGRWGQLTWEGSSSWQLREHSKRNRDIVFTVWAKYCAKLSEVLLLCLTMALSGVCSGHSTTQHWDEKEEADVVNFLPGWTVVSQRERLSHRVTLYFLGVECRGSSPMSLDRGVISLA